MSDRQVERDSHPSDQAMNEYCQGSKYYIDAVESHLGDCAACRQKVVQIVRATLQNERERQRGGES